MVFCVVGLVVFGILGIFSAKYRFYFRQALRCMKRQMMLKPCDSTFDQEMKAKISGKLSKMNPSIGRFVFKNFYRISWLLIIAMIVSFVLIAIGVYNYFAYGNCNGEDSNDFCLFNVFGNAVSFDERVANINLIDPRGGYEAGNPNASVKIIEVGCYSCPYTKDAEQIRKAIMEKYQNNVSFIFKPMPLPSHNLSRETAEAAKCANEQGRYWDYHDKLFENQQNISIDKMKELSGQTGLNETEFSECLDLGKYANEVERDYQDGIRSGIFATPTYFINGQPVVGIKSFASIENIVIGEITGSCPDA